LIENYRLQNENEYSNLSIHPLFLIVGSKEGYMIDKNELCEKIRSIYPDIGECGIAVQVEYDDEQKQWVVDLKKNGHELKTYLEDGDAEKCLQGIQCVSLGIEIAQLRANIERM
jgi:hypothetical protein